jgi:type I restriction enzyme S subunit
MLVGWRRISLASAVGKKGRVFGGPFGSDLTQADYVSSGVPVIRVSNQIGTTIAGDFVYVSQTKARTLAANLAVAGDIVVVQRGSTFGKASRIPPNTEERQYVICQSQMAVSVDPNETSPEYLFQVLRSPAFQRYVDKEVIQTGQPHLNLEILRRYQFPLPPLAEQHKVAEVLGAWDLAIEHLGKLRQLKERLYRALSHGLTFGKLRLRGIRDDWPHTRLAEVTRELTARNRDGRLGKDSVMGVTNSRGIVPMREQTIGTDLSRYKILPPRAFAYNPMRINVGSIAMSRRASDVLVSPDYVLFECIPGKLDAEYLEHMRRGHFWAHYISAGGSGSVRMRTYYNDLAALRIKLPSYDEQVEIANALGAAQIEIELISAQLDALANQKQGLMQKLLSGEWRLEKLRFQE